MQHTESGADGTAADTSQQQPQEHGPETEQPGDPSLNAGRDAFGEVSDFGVQADEHDPASGQADE
jgi:hypothetical protein